MKQLMTKVCLGLCLLLLLGVRSSFAQAGYGLRVEVPFTFTAGNSHFESGQFLIKEATSDAAVLQIQSQEGKAGAILMTKGPLLDNRSESNPRLVFNKYGDHYFLSQIWFGDGQTGCQLHLSKAEQETARTAAASNLKASVVQIAAR